MSEEFDSLRARSWVATPFTQISISSSPSPLQVDNLNIGDRIELTNEMHNEMNIESPPPIPITPYTQTNVDSTYNESVIDLDQHSGDFDIAAFDIIKDRLQKTLQQECYHVLTISTKYDTRLNDERRYNKTINRLKMFVKGLIMYTRNRLNNDKYINDSDVAVVLGAPFNVLPDKILNIDMLKVCPIHVISN